MTDTSDIERLFEENPDVPESGEIINVTRTTAANVYGDAAMNPNQEVLSVTVDDGVGTWDQAFNIPQDALAASHPNQMLGRFRRTYGSLPEVGQEVALELGDDGFPRIQLQLDE